MDFFLPFVEISNNFHLKLPRVYNGTKDDPLTGL